MRAIVKDSKITSLQKRCKRLLVQIDKQSSYVASRRDAVDYAPSDSEKTKTFLATEREASSSPFAVWFAGERADRQRAEAARQEEAMAMEKGIVGDEEGGKKKGKRKGKRGREDDDDDDDDDDEEDEEELERQRAKEKKKKKKAEKAEGGATAKASKKGSKAAKGAAPSGNGSTIPDEVGELRMSDLDSDED